MADSSATASAMYSGVKTKHSTMGYDSSIDHDNVTSMRTGTKVNNIFKYAQDAGMATGMTR